MKEFRSTGLALLLTLSLAGCSKNVSEVGGTTAKAKSPSAPTPGQFTKQAQRPPMAGMRRPVPKLTWDLPSGWQAVRPKSRMRRAEFVLPKAEGAANARLVVYHFPGQGGAPMANIQRWVGQFKSVGDKKTEPKVAKRKVGTFAVTTISHKGTYLQSMGGSMMKPGSVKEQPGFALLAAIVETPSGPWFFKATGPEASIEHNRAAFDTFLGSIKLQAPAPKKAPPAAPKKGQPAKAQPAKDTPAKDTPAKDTPAKDTPAKDTPAKAQPAAKKAGS